MRTGLLALAWLAGLAGCTGSLLKSDVTVPRTYALRPTASSAHDAGRLAARISVGRPRAAPGLDSKHIAVLKEQRELDYIRGAQWGDTAPQVVQSFLVASLESSGRFTSVTSAQSPVPASHLIDIELRDFQVVYEQNERPVARVKLVASVIDIERRRLLDSFELAADVPAEANRLGPITAAMEQASRQVADALAQRVAAAVEASTGDVGATGS
jgi:cholesterol transport system auxiliary component